MEKIEKINAIKSILNLHCKTGATIQDIENDYMYIIGKQLAAGTSPSIDTESFLSQIDGVYTKVSLGRKLWFIENEKTKHISKLIMEQKPPLRYEKLRPEKNVKPLKECFYADNYVYKYKRNKVALPIRRERGHRNSHPIDSQLMGDDLFLSLLTGKQSYNTKPRERIRQWGLSRSALTIRMATEFLKSIAYINTKSIIFNVGSVDVIRDAEMNDMKRDYIEMIKVCRNRNVQPIITTLAPLGKASLPSHMHRKIVEMNNFLFERFDAKVIDLWAPMISSTGQRKYKLFERSHDIDALVLKKTPYELVLWSHAGQKFVLDHLLKKISKRLKDLV